LKGLTDGRIEFARKEPILDKLEEGTLSGIIAGTSGTSMPSDLLLGVTPVGLTTLASRAPVAFDDPDDPQSQDKNQIGDGHDGIKKKGKKEAKNHET
jgi:hypothetical protein